MNQGTGRSEHPAVTEMRKTNPTLFAMLDEERAEMARFATPAEVTAARAAGSDIDLTDPDTLEVMPEEDWKENVARQRAECAEWEAVAKKRVELAGKTVCPLCGGICDPAEAAA